MEQRQYIFSRRLDKQGDITWNSYELPILSLKHRQLLDIQPKTAYVVKRGSKLEKREYWIANLEAKNLKEGFSKAIQMLVNLPFDKAHDVNGKPLKPTEFPMDEFFIKEDTGQIWTLQKDSDC